MLENNFFLVFYKVLPNGSNQLVFCVGFDEAPTVEQTKDVLNNDPRVAELDLTQTYMGLVNREIAMVAFGIDQ